MSAEAVASRTPRRWWTVGLLLHIVLIGVLLLTSPPPLETDPDSWAARADFAGQLVMSSPWWLLTISSQLPAAVPVLANLVVHAAALWLISFRRRIRPTEVDRRWLALSASTVFFVAAGVGVALWAAWLGWDDTASYDIVTRQVESPYVSLQVLGCAVSVGVVTALLARRWSPVASAGGVSAGFWFAWTAWAAEDETGLFMIGAIMLAAGLLFGTSLAAFLGQALGGRSEQMTSSADASRN